MREGKYCMTRPFLGPFGEVWDWVSKAKFVGTVKVDGNRFDVWNYTEGIYTQSLWMNRSHIHKPVRYIAESTNINISVVDFKIYHANPPTDPDEFEVPPICQETMLPTAKHYMNFSQDFDDTEDDKNDN
uniref:Uncharacterized protein n=1 Tax=Amphimedon queenslandica TaxID=400682 RepID=A0A1X7VRQ4_AMPQE